jgi:outer membrane protein assembly factor BamB
VRWTVLTGNEIHDTPAVANGVVYFGSQDHKVWAADAKSGRVLWQFQTLGIVESSPAVVNGQVIVGSDDAKVYAFRLP